MVDCERVSRNHAVVGASARVASLLAVALLVAPLTAALASPPERLDVALRVSGAWGVLRERTWSRPGVDLLGRVRLGRDRRADLGLRLGYAPLDSHTFLSDGEIARVAATGGLRFLGSGSLRVGGVFALENVAFHADPDVLVEHPGVDLLARRGGLVPAAGLEVSFDVRPHLAVGIFGRVGLSKLALYREGDVDPLSMGSQGRSRLVLAGVFLEFSLLR